jgi:hypothetical protein
MSERIVCWFSCGAASAVATKLAIEENARRLNPLPLVVARIAIADEHEDNDRFSDECAQWFGVPIVTLTATKYAAGGDVATLDEVARIERYMSGPKGAACTRVLKKEVRYAFESPHDVQVFGYTAEEQGRVDRFIDGNAYVKIWPILVEKGLMKSDCKAMLERAGIRLAAMYELDYYNNNCIGCWKGGAGYFNKIRVDFPLVFQDRVRQSRALGVRLVKFEGKRIFLDELPPDAGDYPTEQEVECGIFCELAEREMNGEPA